MGVSQIAIIRLNFLLQESHLWLRGLLGVIIGVLSALMSHEIDKPYRRRLFLS